MHFEIWRSWARLIFLEPNAWGYAVLALELLLTLGILSICRRDFFNLDRPGFLLLVGCLVAPLASERLLVLGFSGSNLLPRPGLPFTPSQPIAPLLGMVPVGVAGAWLGPGPALLVGLAQGALRAGATTGGIAEPFHLGFFGFLVGFLLRQDYRGRLPRVARQPVVALPLMAPIAAVLLLISSFGSVAASGLSGLDYAVSLTSSYAGPMLIESLVAAVALQAIYAVFPQRRPVRVTRRAPPYSRTLNRRLLFLFVPLVGLITVVLVYAVTTTALRLAKSEAVTEMARDARMAAEQVPPLVQTGQGLLMEFASDEGLRGEDEEALVDRLRRDMQMVVFFDQLVLLNSSSEILAQYPSGPSTDVQLTPQEQALVSRGTESGAPQISPVHRSQQGIVIMSFLAPMSDSEQGQEGGAPSRLLLGRTHVEANPIIDRILQGLQWTHAQGEGFIVDSDGRVVAHPSPGMLLTVWALDDAGSRLDSARRGWAYESRDAQDNTRQLVYYLPVDGHPWGVVIRMPYEVVLEQAGQIAAPLLGLQVLLGGGLVLIVSLATNWVTHPLRHLATAADRIADGDLSRPVEVRGTARQEGQDEIARVGAAFEDMRKRLKDRLEDLSLLLEVSRAVSATLELPEGVPFILEGALEAAGAQVARVVLLSEDGDLRQVMSRGESWDGLDSLDSVLGRAVKNLNRPLVIGNLVRARTLFEPATRIGPVKALLAVPIYAKERVSGVVWIGYAETQQFRDSDVDLLSTLAGQMSVLIENARLFQTAESERRRLAAILDSTTDAVIVTERDNRILLMNPAAERAFDVNSESVFGKTIDQAPLPEALVDVFREPLDRDEAPTRELVLSDGRTLYANVSPILNADGERLGRVSLMRDITQLKELDDLKSDFVATVSHDLRAPLTFMRGYTTMLWTQGELSETQQEYVEKILQGVDRMNNLVDDLLDLRRIESGVGLTREPCHLGVILTEAVDSRRMRAAGKDITLRVEPKIQGESEPSGRDARQKPPLVSGDPALLRQAVTNLVDNAIKYTPNGGEVAVELSVAKARGSGPEGEKRQALIHVKDTGIGISPEDQVRLFEKFYRARRRDVQDISGTGLGLAIVKSIVERHGGAVWVDSELDEGSTFTISLPMIEQDERSEGEDA